MDGSHSDLSTENVFVLNLDQLSKAKRNLSTLAHQTKEDSNYEVSNLGRVRSVDQTGSHGRSRLERNVLAESMSLSKNSINAMRFGNAFRKRFLKRF